MGFFVSIKKLLSGPLRTKKISYAKRIKNLVKIHTYFKSKLF